jgi:cold shock CspA family protein
MQATVAKFSSDTHCGTVLLDDGAGLPFDTNAFAGSGLRFLRLGQRVNIRVVDGRIAAITLATFPIE